MAGPELSLCIGVTGHRDIEPAALPEIERLVRAAFERLAAEFGLGMVVFSSLAEGADRLVAQVALERGHPLVVPLPLPLERYEQDFQTDESKAEFRRLLGKAEKFFAVEDESVSTEPAEAGVPDHVAGYRRAGLFVARSCHVLLALWDGVQPGSPAGTWEIVQAKRAGESPIGRPDARHAEIKEPRGVVVQIRTPRVGALGAVAPALLWPGEKERAWLAIAKTAEFTRRFNSDSTALAAHIAQVRKRSSSAHNMAKRPGGPSPEMDRLIELYVKADAMALYNQKRVRFSWIALYCAAVAAVCAYALYAHVERHHPLLLVGYLAAIALGYVAYQFVAKARWHDRFLDYRALAEGLRVSFYWRAAGLAGDPVDRYPANLAAEVEWVRLILRGETARCEPRQPELLRTPETLAFAEKNWVEAQATYFRDAAEGHSRRARDSVHRAERGVRIGVIVAVVLLAIQLVDETWLHHVGEGWLFPGLLVAVALVPAIGAAIAGYADRRGYEAQARQYERMADLFVHARMVLASLVRDQDKRLVLSRLAGEALAEQAQWVALHRERPFEFISGGG